MPQLPVLLRQLKRWWRGMKDGGAKWLYWFFYLIFLFSFDEGDTARVRVRYGRTGKWVGLGYMMWNYQRMSKKYVRKPLWKCTCGGYMNMSVGTHKVQRFWILWSWSFEKFCVSLCRCWEQHMGWLQGQRMIETTEPFLKLHHHLVARRVSLFCFVLVIPPPTFSEDLNLIRTNKNERHKDQNENETRGNGKIYRNGQRWHTTASWSRDWWEAEIHLEETWTAVLRNLIKNVRFIIRR